MKQYKTIDIARRIGIHVNTVRLYEKCALIPKPDRLPNGYRVFTDLHIEQFKLARAALRVEVLQNGLRKQAVNIIKVSLILIYLVGSLFFGVRLPGSVGIFLASYFLVMLSTFSIGMMVGGVAPNMKVASIVASVLYFPMLIFSGATLPYEVMPTALQRIADILPLTQGIKLLKAASLGLPIEVAWLPLVVMVALIIICGGIAVKFFKWE